ncbi:MAG: hypothetical protein QW412_03655, partial [Candidatus Aenigmatarchaeota archaeon]
SLHQIAWMLYPFIPQTAEEIGKRLGIKALLEKNPLLANAKTPLPQGASIIKGKPLFPKIPPEGQEKKEKILEKIEERDKKEVCQT